MTFQKGNRKASKLSGEQVVEIRDRYQMPGVTIKQLALDYGVSRNTVSSILDGLTWRDVAGGQGPVRRPALNPQPGPQSGVEESLARLERLMSSGKPPSLYDSPPSTEDEDNATAARAADKFNSQDETSPRQQQLRDELDKLKGD